MVSAPPVWPPRPVGPSAPPLPAVHRAARGVRPPCQFLSGVLSTDNGSGTVVASLSWAIDLVDADTSDSATNPDRITFDVNGGGAQTISVTQELPTITRPVIIGRTTQPGFSTTTYVPLVRIDGSALPFNPPRSRTRTW